MRRSLRTRRLEAGLTQRQLAELAGVAHSTVGATERGEAVLKTSAAKVELALQRWERRRP